MVEQPQVAEDQNSVARERYVDLVFEGGGVKGIALVGALSVLEEQGYEPQNIAGTSAGAIVAALLAAGYTAAELRTIIAGEDFASFMDTAWEDRLPFVGAGLSILKDQGLYEGNVFYQRMHTLLAAKGVHTFRDLIHPKYADQPRYRYKAQMIASDITDRRMLVLPSDAKRLGIEPDDLEVAMAVRMSMSIPIFFEPVRIQHPETKREHLIVDGGMLSNFPVWLFDSQGEPDWPTFGLLLVEPEPTTPLIARLPESGPTRGPIEVVVDYVKSLAQTMMEAHDRLYVEKANFARTIAIPTLGVSTTEFKLSSERTEALYESGRSAARRFLETWDFAGYIAEFRRGKTHSRRLEIAEEMQAAGRS